MAISHCYWHLVVKNGNFTLLLTSSGQKWQFHIATDIYWSKMAISHCYWYLLVKNGNFTLLLTSSGQKWQFHIATDIYWSKMAISHCYWHLWSRMAMTHCYWHLVVHSDNAHCYLHLLIKNGKVTLLLTSSGQEWQLADVLLDLLADLPHKCIMGYILYNVFGSHVGFLKKRWEFLVICE